MNKLIKTVAILGLIMSPVLASAQYYQNNYSSTDRATQIAQIQAQITALYQQILALQNGSVLGATYPSNYSTYPYYSQNQNQPCYQYTTTYCNNQSQYSQTYPYNQYSQYGQYMYQPQYQNQNQYQNQYQYNQYSNVTPTVSLTANAATVPRSGPVTLNWTSNYATTCSGAGATWTGVKGMGGSEYISHVDTPTTFILTCTNSYSGLSGSGSVTVNVN